MIYSHFDVDCFTMQCLSVGMSGGRTYVDTGSGTNTLCLPHNPDPSPPDFPRSFQHNDVSYAGSIHGSEYQFNYRHVAIDDDVPCAACMVTNASSTLMIPAKTSCPIGWTVQYQGVLTSGKQGHQATDYLCLDQNPEYLTEGARMHNYDGKLFYPVHAICGSLPCPPYKGHAATAVLCSLFHVTAGNVVITSMCFYFMNNKFESKYIFILVVFRCRSN